eukprot:m.234077 g.234077  ORF g.234077 m.234077 type:complete len:150 (+) comp13912_c0_seq7:1477-1926(+)
MGDDVKYKSIMPAFSRDLISRLAMAACAKIQSDGLFVQLRTDRETNQPKINVSHSIEPPTSYNTQIKPKQSNNKATPSSISTSTQEQKQEQEVKILKASLQESTEEKDQLLRALHDLSKELVKAKKNRAEAEARLHHIAAQQNKRIQRK